MEPIPVVVKTNRGGLGQEAHQKRKQEIQAMMRTAMATKRRKMEEKHKGDFMERKSKQFSEKLAERDLYKSQKVCEQLDSQKVWRWTTHAIPCKYINFQVFSYV